MFNISLSAPWPKFSADFNEVRTRLQGYIGRVKATRRLHQPWPTTFKTNYCRAHGCPSARGGGGGGGGVGGGGWGGGGGGGGLCFVFGVFVCWVWLGEGGGFLVLCFWGGGVVLFCLGFFVVFLFWGVCLCVCLFGVFFLLVFFFLVCCGFLFVFRVGGGGGGGWGVGLSFSFVLAVRASAFVRPALRPLYLLAATDCTTHHSALSATARPSRRNSSLTASATLPSDVPAGKSEAGNWSSRLSPRNHITSKSKD